MQLLCKEEFEIVTHNINIDPVDNVICFSFTLYVKKLKGETVMKFAILFFMAMSALRVIAMDKELKTVTLKPMSVQHYASCTALSFLFDHELQDLIQDGALALIKNSSETAQESVLCMQLENLKIIVDFKNTEQLDMSRAKIDHKAGGLIATIIVPK